MTHHRTTEQAGAAAPTALYTTTMPSPVGPLTLVAHDDALIAVLWPEELDGRVRFEQDPVETAQHPVLDLAVTQLDEYFEGSRRSFALPLEPRGTDFQRLVWWSLAEIPFGETSTYGKQAANIGRPTAVRAVGAANGRNPLSIVLPCHRIVGADGKLTGFAGGIETKRWLLDHERAHAAD
jgi:methylated-DNA-[protein]-cysteine S-methyltransferase